MAEATEQRAKGAPTEKMISAAKLSAERHAVPLPPDYDKDFDGCKVFLDTYLSKPSPKALAFAEKIAKDKGVALSPEARTNGKALSVWIDEHK